MDSQPAAYRLLIADDAPEVCEALRYALEGEGDLVVVGEASNGIEAIEHVAALAPDVVILDIELPRLDGYAVARSLKTSPHPPVVIFLTMHSDALSRQRAAESGGDGFAAKGAGWPALIAEIRRVLAGRAPERLAPP
jgi:DNA-binding NarL/FixJ family response regulator